MSTTRLRDVMPRHAALAAWERQRNKKEVHWIMECFAEMVRERIHLLHCLSSYNLQSKARSVHILLLW